MYKYKNATDHTLTVVGVGQVEPGQVFESAELLENPNLVIADQVAEQPAPVVGREQPQPAAIINAAPVQASAAPVNQEAN